MGASKLIVAAAVAAFGLGAATATVSHGNEYATPNDNQPVQTVTIGQGGYMRLPDLRPAQPAYSLTGTNENRRTLRAWQGEAGPILQVGNARIVLPPTR